MIRNILMNTNVLVIVLLEKFCEARLLDISM